MESFCSSFCCTVVLSFTICLAVRAELSHIYLLGNLAAKVDSPFLELGCPA